MSVVLDVRLCCFRCMVCCMLQVPVCGMRMVRRRQMIAGLVMFSGLAVVTRGVLVMLCCVVVVFCCLFGHTPSQVDFWAEGRDGTRAM
jgi:hypothetical protein